MTCWIVATARILIASSFVSLITAASTMRIPPWTSGHDYRTPNAIDRCHLISECGGRGTVLYRNAGDILLLVTSVH